MDQQLIEEFNVTYNDYLIRPDFYRTDVIRNVINIPDIVFNIVPNTAPQPNLINDVLTKSITKYFLSSTETILEIINLYVKIYEHALNRYIQTHPQYNLNTTKLWFALKGGLAMFLNISKEVFKMPGDIGEIFNDKFVKNSFHKSDIDFAVLINYNEIEERYHEIIFIDILNISFIILLIVRNYIVKKKYEFSDFEKNNDEYKKIILKNIRKNINQSLLNNGIGRLGNNFCKIGTSKIYEEEPCPNNVEITNDIAYDEIYVHDNNNFNNITINHPSRYADFNLTSQNKYIISANIIQFRNAQNYLIKFGLTRMKVFFGLYKLNYENNRLGCCDYQKGKGEIIDVGISHYKSYFKSNFNNYDRYTINNYEFNMPTNNYFKIDHYEMLVVNYNFPWNLPKFEKRLDRYFSFCFIILLNNLNNQNIQQLILFFDTYHHHISLHNQDLNFDNNPLMNNPLNYPNINQNQNPNEFELVTLLNQTINRLHSSNYNNELNNLNIFIQKLLTNVINIIDILNRTRNYIQNPTLTFYNNNLSIRTNMFGGFDICSMDGSQKILKKIINKLINISSYLPLDTNVHDRFYNSYRKLIEIFLNNDTINQKFIDNLNNVIYDSSIDQSDNMIESNGDRKNIKNGILNITAFMFLDYLLDYHCFLITFQNERYNTDINNAPNGTKNFMTLLWKEASRESDLYRHELVGKNPEQLLKDFCFDINIKFYRFISLLLKNLVNLLKTYLPINLQLNPPNDLINITIDEIKNIMFAVNHHTINNYDETSIYNYMYHCWKNMLANWMFNKYNGLTPNNFPPTISRHNDINLANLKNFFITVINDCISDTITNCLRQNGQNQYNERYISDSGGLFSYSYMLRRPLMGRNGYNIKTYFASCITSSIIEIYLLIRIWENPENVGLGSESAINNIHGRHAYWTITQTIIGHSITHWTCKWNRLVYRGRGVFNDSVHIFRNVYNNVNNRTIYLTNQNTRKSFLKYFLYHLIDYRIEYIRQNNFRASGVVKSQFLSNELKDNIINFIQ